MSIYQLSQNARWLLTGYPGRKYRELLNESETWPRDQCETFRNEKLQTLITHCYENVPFYRRVMQSKKIVPADIGTVEDLAKLPILTKHDLRTHHSELIAKNVGAMKVSWAKTGGTTGEPVKICRNIDAVAMAAACYVRGLRWGGLSPATPRIRLFGGSLGLDNERPTKKIRAFLRTELFLPAFELRSDTAGIYFQKIRRCKSRFLIGYASAIFRLATLARDAQESIDFDAVFPTAELMLPQWEQVIRDVFKCKVLPYYGCGEVHSLGFSRPDSSGYLIPEEHALIELAHTSGSTKLYGDGQFLLTDLDNYAMPIVRYLNGDAGKIVPPSGEFPFSRIERLDGRYNSLLMTERGELISGVIGTHIFRNTLSVRRYQIIQEEPLQVVIKIIPNGELTENDRELVLRLFSAHLGSRMKISIEIVAELPVPPSGKSVFVINRCLQDSASDSSAYAAI